MKMHKNMSKEEYSRLVYEYFSLSNQQTCKENERGYCEERIIELIPEIAKLKDTIFNIGQKIGHDPWNYYDNINNWDKEKL